MLLSASRVALEDLKGCISSVFAGLLLAFFQQLSSISLVDPLRQLGQRRFHVQLASAVHDTRLLEEAEGELLESFVVGEVAFLRFSEDVGFDACLFHALGCVLVDFFFLGLR